jgi:hypothetical protein
MLRLIAEISAFLGEPGPYEVERSFLIEYPDLDMLSSLDSCRRIEITQTYLEAGSEKEVRIRQRGADGIEYKIRRDVNLLRGFTESATTGSTQ